MEHTLVAIFNQEVENFLVRWKMSPTTFGRLAVANKHLVWRLRAGKQVMPATMDRVRAFMRDYAGEGLTGTARRKDETDGPGI